MNKHYDNMPVIIELN